MIMMNTLLARSKQLESQLVEFLALPPFDNSKRVMASKVMCSIAFEHAESAKLLTCEGNVTSATALVRLQFEALTRAMWLLYAASDSAVEKLTDELSSETVDKANRLPMLSGMLEQLQGKAPQEPLNMLLEFKSYSWKPLSSYIHGGIHAVHRHGNGFPFAQIEQMILISNGLSIMVGMLAVILHGGGSQRGKLPKIQKEYADCLPAVSIRF